MEEWDYAVQKEKYEGFQYSSGIIFNFYCYAPTIHSVRDGTNGVRSGGAASSRTFGELPWLNTIVIDLLPKRLDFTAYSTIIQIKNTWSSKADIRYLKGNATNHFYRLVAFC